MFYITNPPNSLADSTILLILYRWKLTFTEILHFVQDHITGKLFSLPIAPKRPKFPESGLLTNFFQFGVSHYSYISTHVTEKLKIQIFVCISGQVPCPATGLQHPKDALPTSSLLTQVAPHPLV